MLSGHVWTCPDKTQFTDGRLMNPSESSWHHLSPPKVSESNEKPIPNRAKKLHVSTRRNRHDVQLTAIFLTSWTLHILAALFLFPLPLMSTMRSQPPSLWVDLKFGDSTPSTRCLYVSEFHCDTFTPALTTIDDTFTRFFTIWYVLFATFSSTTWIWLLIHSLVIGISKETWISTVPSVDLARCRPWT
jgi:hypothetical protein